MPDLPADYTIDTSVLIRLKDTMPMDLFPSVWKNLETLAADGRVCICRQVLVELERGGDDLYDWVKGHIAMTPCEPGDAEVLTVAEIALQFQGWVSGRDNEADPWLVAHGKHESRVVVTNEGPGGPLRQGVNQRIPYVAAQFGVETTDYFDMARKESWSF